MIWFTPGAEQGLLEDRRIHLFCSDEKILLWPFGNALGNCWALTHVWGSYALSVQAMNLKSAYQEENRDVDRKPRSPRGVLTKEAVDSSLSR